MNYMLKAKELNILCMGQLTSDKSAFLSFYTRSSESDDNYKVFVHKQRNIEVNSQFEESRVDEQKSLVVFLHEIEELEGVEVYLKYPYDAILFFVKIDQFHNTSKNILDALQLYSQINGANVYKVPFKIVVVSNKNQNYYDDIGRGDKQSLFLEVYEILSQDQIIFVQYDGQYEDKLSRFYRNIIMEQALGIKESAYANWYFRGFRNYFSFGQLKLTLFKIYGQLRYLIKSRWKNAGQNRQN